MIDQEINEAIALACGWIYYDGWHHPDGRSELPNYCTDLNAMHEAEKSTFGSSTQWLDFVCNLITVLSCAEMSELDGMTCILQASARDHAEAFLRTIGKWEESK
jgi:hypothetical protein